LLYHLPGREQKKEPIRESDPGALHSRAEEQRKENPMNKKLVGLVAGVALSAAAATTQAALIQSATSTLGGGAITFEGLGEGTLVPSLGGVNFGQDDGGTPMIDNQPFLFGYDASSGTAVLTGSTTGGAPFPTVAGLTLTPVGPVSAIEFHLGDTSPLGVYTIQAFGAGNVLLESFAVTPGNFVGFTGLAGIVMVTVDSSVFNDAFAIDDVRFVRAQIPEPGSLALLGIALAGACVMRRRKTTIG
jgi:PEP-CTERM motif-containing protein